MSGLYPRDYNNVQHTTLVISGMDETTPLKKKDEEEKANIFSRCCAFFFSESSDAYVDVLLSSNFLYRAMKFLPALLITFGIELGNSAVLGDNQDVLQRHFTLVLFIPVISAIAGNVGLQTSSSVTAYINLRLVEGKPVKVRWLLGKYIAHTAVQIIILSTLMGLIACYCYKSPCQYAYGVIIFSGAIANMVIAAIAGVWTPIILNKFGYDPSSGAGPFETALQDVVGACFFVWFAKLVLSSSWPAGCEL